MQWIYVLHKKMSYVSHSAGEKEMILQNDTESHSDCLNVQRVKVDVIDFDGSFVGLKDPQ